MALRLMKISTRIGWILSTQENEAIIGAYFIAEEKWRNPGNVQMQPRVMMLFGQRKKDDQGREGKGCLRCSTSFENDFRSITHVTFFSTRHVMADSLEKLLMGNDRPVVIH